MADVLTIDKLSAGYGEAVALSGISLTLREGEALALLGRNGVGKTTLLNSIIGVTRRFTGTIVLSGQDVTRYRPEQRAVAALPKDVTVLLIEHDMDLVFSFADRIAVLVNGALFADGPPSEIANNPRVKSVYLGEGLDG